MNGPFGSATLVKTLPASHLVGMYREKCGVDVSAWLPETLELYECDSTGYRFWRPESVAGDEAFYRELSAAWPNYYRDWRWEYDKVLPYLKATDSILEIGCGRGYFLKAAEAHVASAKGIEFNREAIANKVCGSPVIAARVEDLSEQFDAICSFQVLEHVVDPASFLSASIAGLKDGGLLLISTPNYENRTFAAMGDCFDMPPHHVGHFTEAVYQRVAKKMGVKLIAVKTQKEGGLLRRLLLRRPGHTMLAVFRKQ